MNEWPTVRKTQTKIVQFIRKIHAIQRFKHNSSKYETQITINCLNIPYGQNLNVASNKYFRYYTGIASPAKSKKSSDIKITCEHRTFKADLKNEICHWNI